MQDAPNNQVENSYSDSPCLYSLSIRTFQYSHHCKIFIPTRL